MGIIQAGCCLRVALLCCAVLCCAVLCCAVLCCAVLCCAVLRCAALCCAVLCHHAVSPPLLLNLRLLHLPFHFSLLLLASILSFWLCTGHLGKNSSDLISYYEAIPGVQSIPDDLNPATWMLEVTTPGNEEQLGVDFAAVFNQSSLCRCAQQCRCCFLLMLAAGGAAAAAAAACAIQMKPYCFIMHAGGCVLHMSFIRTGLQDAMSLGTVRFCWKGPRQSTSATDSVMMMPCGTVSICCTCARLQHSVAGQANLCR